MGAKERDKSLYPEGAHLWTGATYLFIYRNSENRKHNKQLGFRNPFANRAVR